MNFVKTGPGKWYITGGSDWNNTNSFDIQEGIVILSGKRADGDQRRFMSGNLTIGENAQLTLNSTDMLWTGWLKNVNNNQKGSIEKIGDGTLRLTSMEGKTFDHKNGTNVEAGRLILDAASMTGSDVTVAPDAVFAAVNGSVIGKNLNVNGTYELILEEIAASEEEFQLMISDQLLFGDYATARINASGDVNWNALNGKNILRLNSAEYAADILNRLGNSLSSDPYYPYTQLISEGLDIKISFEFNEVPEPASWLLLLLGAAGLAWSSRSSRLNFSRFFNQHAKP